jgi:hypothetical protein
MWYLVFWLITMAGATTAVQLPHGFASPEECDYHGKEAGGNLRTSRDLVNQPVLAYTCVFQEKE